MPSSHFSFFKQTLFAVFILFQSCAGTNLDKFPAYDQFNTHLDDFANQNKPFNINDSLVPDNINAIDQGEFKFFNSEGYNIDVEFFYEPLSEKAISGIERKI